MSERAVRVARSIQRELGDIITNEVKDPRVQGAGLLTVMHVNVTPDLSLARVAVTVHGADAAKMEEVLAGLAKAAPHIRRALGRRIESKRLPELRFSGDETEERADRVEQILRELEAERKK